MAAPITEPAEIMRRLVEQVTGTVRWRESVAYMAGHGVAAFYEVGAGKVLSGLVKRIADGAIGTPIGTPEDVAAFKAARVTAARHVERSLTADDLARQVLFSMTRRAASRDTSSSRNGVWGARGGGGWNADRKRSRSGRTRLAARSGTIGDAAASPTRGLDRKVAQAGAGGERGREVPEFGGQHARTGRQHLRPQPNT